MACTHFTPSDLTCYVYVLATKFLDIDSMRLSFTITLVTIGVKTH